jgi:hypothetical protein
MSCFSPFNVVQLDSILLGLEVLVIFYHKPLASPLYPLWSCDQIAAAEIDSVVGGNIPI